MDAIQLDMELDTKSKETFKLILKNLDTEITFELPDEEHLISEITTIQLNEHSYVLYTTYDINDTHIFNLKYNNLLTLKQKIKIKKMKIENDYKLIRKKLWYLFPLIPFLGRIIRRNNELQYSYNLSYNSVIIGLSKIEYDRFMYYTKYVFKLQQLHKLNEELGIKQDFFIIFDDDKSAIDLYKGLFDSFDGIINKKNNNSNFGEDDEEDEDEEN